MLVVSDNRDDVEVVFVVEKPLFPRGEEELADDVVKSGLVPVDRDSKTLAVEREWEWEKPSASRLANLRSLRR